MNKIKKELDAFLSASIKDAVHDYVASNPDVIMDATKKAIKIKKIELKIDKKKVKKMGLTHKQFDELIKVVSADLPVLMVGEPGTGKTTAAEQVADALGLSFHAISVGAQTTKSDILGFIDAQGVYHSTPFRKAFENGGVFLMDEIDAGNPNVLIMINSAISNGFVEFPDKLVKRHANFRFVGTANTYGNGVDAKFVGRNQLDAATIDRFVNIYWSIDTEMEKLLTANHEWHKIIERLRQTVSEQSLSIIITPRASIYGAKLLEKGFTIEEALKMAVYKGLSKDVVTTLDESIESLKN